MQCTWYMYARVIDVWIDASSLDTGVSLEINGSVTEDACWLRSTNDAQQIDLTELDAALKGINLALQ